MERSVAQRPASLFPLLATLPINVAKNVVGEQTALRLLIVKVAALWVVALYLLLRAVTPGRLDALIFTALGSVSAAAVFWLPVPETYAMGSVSVIAALALCAWDPTGRAGATAYVTAAAFSLAVTTTNWVSGLAAIFVPQALANCAATRRQLADCRRRALGCAAHAVLERDVLHR